MSLSSRLGSVSWELWTGFRRPVPISNQLIPANYIRCKNISTNSVSPTSGSTSRTKGSRKASNDIWADFSRDGLALPKHRIREILSTESEGPKRVITSSREVATKAAKEASDIPGNLFTDGSRLESGYCGSSVVWKTATDDIWHNQRIHLGDDKDVLDAELYAISEALQTAMDRKILTDGRKEVRIYSDSLSALHSIQNKCRDPWKWLVKRIGERENLLLKGGYTVQYHWVPGHEGIRGNEEADKAAKTAAAMPVMAGVTHIRREDLFQKIKRKK